MLAARRHTPAMPKWIYFHASNVGITPSRNVEILNSLSRQFSLLYNVQHLHAPSNQLRHICSMSYPYLITCMTATAMQLGQSNRGAAVL